MFSPYPICFRKPYICAIRHYPNRNFERYHYLWCIIIFYGFIMSNLKKITALLLLLCTTGVSYAYSEAWRQINFSYISINDGLSQSTVFSIAQDKLGNMWFATYEGVNKYDGYAFTVYQHDENDPNSIANDIARIVMTDSKRRVWIGTRDGLSYYDENKDKFQNFSYEKNGKRLQVNGIVEVSATCCLSAHQRG